jgi:hypothetical protein
MHSPQPKPQSEPQTHRAIRVWLLMVAALMFATLVVGGRRVSPDRALDRRMEAGHRRRSAVDAAAWQAEFDKCKTIPQFRDAMPA